MSWVFESAWPDVTITALDGSLYRGKKVFGWVFWKDQYDQFHHQWVGMEKENSYGEEKGISKEDDRSS